MLTPVVLNPVPISGFENLFDASTFDDAMVTLAKLGIAALLGGLIGIERDLARRPAGIRTHMLVCVACALFTEISRSFDTASPDRIAAQIVTGVGFLGAGTIMRTGLGVRGLTTAASIFAVAAIGMGCSVGGAFLWVAVGATILTLITLRTVGAFEARVLDDGRFAKIEVSAESRDVVAEVLASLAAAGSHPRRIDVRVGETGLLMKATFDAKDPSALNACLGVPGVTSAEWAEEEA